MAGLERVVLEMVALDWPFPTMHRLTVSYVYVRPWWSVCSVYSHAAISEANLNPAEAETPAAKRAAADRRPIDCLGLGFLLAFERQPLDMVAVAVAVVFVALDR